MGQQPEEGLNTGGEVVHQVKQLKVVFAELRLHIRHHLACILPDSRHHESLSRNASQLLHMCLVVEQCSLLIRAVLVAELFPAHRVARRDETSPLKRETHDIRSLLTRVNHYLVNEHGVTLLYELAFAGHLLEPIEHVDSRDAHILENAIAVVIVCLTEFGSNIADLDSR